MEEDAKPVMLQLLQSYGLQICLKTLADSLEEVMAKRGVTLQGVLILEVLRGIHAGYLRRYDTEIA